jgi:hypothetical protein
MSIPATSMQTGYFHSFARETAPASVNALIKKRQPDTVVNAGPDSSHLPQHHPLLMSLHPPLPTSFRCALATRLREPFQPKFVDPGLDRCIGVSS